MGNITNQSCTIRVVAQYLSTVESQRIDGPRPSCPFAKLCTQPECLFLERHGDIRSLAASRHKIRYGQRKLVNSDKARFVDQILPACLGKSRVNGR